MFDVLVIGGGHAGVEAAAAAARCGARAGLLTLDPATIGAMSCNPAIGGIGKGHIVREVDAFDGLMARAADAAAIHYRMLNRSKGLAVHGPRVQADRRRYAAAVRALIAGEGVTVLTGEATGLLLSGTTISGVELSDGAEVSARALVIASGTFLGGRIFRGDDRLEGGRIGERSATRLGNQLRDLGLPLARLKTGTPPRLDGRTIDWAKLAAQPSDTEPWTMSPMSGGRALPQIACAVTRTTHATHDVIRGGLDRSPLFRGDIAGVGPRYCPSIEDKVKRFGDRDGHTVFLEPEGLDNATVYPNGISTSLPVDVQTAMIATIPGLERAAIVEPGYAVEYDHVDPRALDAALAVQHLRGLYLAGQINGTTGYEEAAGQGVVAGLNAAAHALARPPTILDRADSYIGVMIDDLVLQGVSEPYRMLTARAEHRLRLRSDNAETRLQAVAIAAGCVSEARLRRWERRRAARAEIDRQFEVDLTATDIADRDGRVSQDGSRRPVREWLRFDGLSVEMLAPELGDLDDTVVAEAVEDARYAPYLARLERDRLAARDLNIAFAGDIDFSEVAGLSTEMIERISVARPASLAEASRIRGVSPAALTALLLHVKRAA